MFLYWNGYEIDGFDTDFDIVVPETAQIADFVECFLPSLFADDIRILLSTNLGKEEMDAATLLK